MLQRIVGNECACISTYLWKMTISKFSYWILISTEHGETKILTTLFRKAYSNCKRQNDSVAIVVERSKSRWLGLYQSCERDLVTCYLFQTVCIFHCYQGATSQLVRITKAPFIIVVTKKPKSSSSFILSFIKYVLFRVWKENFHLHRGEPRLMSWTAWQVA